MIFVFKTSVKTIKQVRKLRPHIDNMRPKVKWNFDLEDCDKILRIEGDENVILPITTLLKIHNFECEELE